MRQQLESRSPSFWIRYLVASIVCLLFGAGCATAPQGSVVTPGSAAASPVVSEINEALASASFQTPGVTPDYRLGPEDLLQITMYNIPEGEGGVTPHRTEVRVSQQGIISLPLLGDIGVAGLTPAGLEQLLKGRFNRYFHNPQIGVQVLDYRSQAVTVMGAVRNPGIFQLTGPKTLIDLLSMAGGITERAGGQVHLYRDATEGRQSHVIDLLVLAKNPALVNMPVQAGDVINVQQAGMFFVDGAVGRPGSYPLSQAYTLTQALTVAGGVVRTLASYSEVAIYRQNNGLEADRIPIDLRTIWNGKARDPHIEANDVIVVPISTGKYIVERFLGRIGLGGPPRYGL